MTINSSLAPELAKLQQTSAYVELYTLDSTNIVGGQVYRFTNFANSSGGGSTFGGVTYQPFPISTSGWDFSSSGALPRPTVTVSNVQKTLLSAVINLGDLVGAKFTRIRTYEKFLDTGSTPNSSAYLGPDTYYIEEMSYMDSTMISFTLSNALDRMGMKFPGRQVLKDQSVKHLYAPGVSRTRFR